MSSQTLGKRHPELETLVQQLHTPFACVHVENGLDQTTTHYVGDWPNGVPRFVTTANEEDTCEATLPREPTAHDICAGTHESNIPCGKAMFEIASLGKDITALVICVLVHSDDERFKDLHWETKAFQLMKKHRPNFKGLDVDSTVADLVLHRNGYPPEQFDMFRSYEGKFMTSKEDFLTNGATLGNKNQDLCKGYSTCNYIFLVLLIEQLAGEKFSTLVDKLFLKRLKMDNTILDADQLNKFLDNKNTHEKYRYRVDGHRVSADGKISPVPKFEDPINEIEAVAFKWRSCTDDLASLFREIFKRERHKAVPPKQGVEQEEYLFSVEVVHDFFKLGSDWNPAGYYTALASNQLGMDSLNALSRPKDVGSSYNLGKAYIKGPKRVEEEEIYVYMKGGTMDGFTGSIYINFQFGIFVLALANADGPLEFTDYACHVMLQEVLPLQNGGDVVHMALNKDLPRARALYRDIEDSDALVPPHSKESIQRFVGTYQHNDHRYMVKVTDGGYFIRYASRDDSVSPSIMLARVVDDVLRVYPHEGHLFSVDRKSSDMRIRYSLDQDRGETQLVLADEWVADKGRLILAFTKLHGPN